MMVGLLMGIFEDGGLFVANKEITDQKAAWDFPV